MTGKLPPYRAGRVHVLARMCDSCIFRPNGLHMEPKRRDEMVSAATQADSAIICHSTLSDANAVCRGFYELHPTKTLKFAAALGIIELDSAEGRHP